MFTNVTWLPRVTVMLFGLTALFAIVIVGVLVPPPPGGPSAPSGRLMSAAPVRESFRDVKFRIQSRVIQDLDPKLDLSNQVEVRRQIEEIFGKVIDEEGLALTRAERVRMLEQITDEIIGLGPLEPLLRDESITEVMVNGPRQVYIERSGKLELTNVVFHSSCPIARRRSRRTSSDSQARLPANVSPRSSRMTHARRHRASLSSHGDSNEPLGA